MSIVISGDIVERFIGVNSTILLIEYSSEAVTLTKSKQWDLSIAITYLSEIAFFKIIENVIKFHVIQRRLDAFVAFTYIFWVDKPEGHY